MNYTILLLLLGGILAGCCTKEMCVGADNMDLIGFYDFDDPGALDTIIVKKYTRGSGMIAPIDSFTTVSAISGTINAFQSVMLSRKLTDSFDYRLELPGAGRIYDITDFVVKKKRCNTGFLCNDTYRALESYRVNGRTVEGQWQVVLYR